MAAALLLHAGAAGAQESDADLAKKAANPVSGLISVPLQNNFDCCIGPEDGFRYTLNIQPVVPVAIDPSLNLIIRTILPVIHLGETQADAGDHSGLGDITQSFFFVPRARNGITLGLGPVFLWPIGDSHLGSQQWAAGPTFVIVRQSGPVTFGMLANQLWTYAGNQRRDHVDQTFLQPFVSYSFRSSTTLSLNTETGYDWTHRAWTVPVNLSISHIYKFGRQRVQLAFGAKYYAVSPDGPDWGKRVTATFLFPK